MFYLLWLYLSSYLFQSSIFYLLSSLFIEYAKQFVQEETLRNMYLSIVETHLRYCCSVWGCCGDTKLNTLHKLQNRAARIVTGSPFDSSAALLLQRLGWLSVDRLVSRETSTRGANHCSKSRTLSKIITL